MGGRATALSGMPDGFLVTLGDGSLDPGDAVSDPVVTFVTDTVLGPGVVTFTNVNFGFFTFPSFTDDGDFFLATDGNVYFVPDFSTAFLNTFASATVISAPSFTSGIFGTSGDDPLILGTADDDQIFGGPTTDPAGTGDDTIAAGAGDDSVFGGDGDDSIAGETGNDRIEGGLGSDTIDAGSGDDTIFGDTDTSGSGSTEALDWTDQGGGGTDLTSGFTQNTGLIDVTVGFTEVGNNNASFDVSTATNFVGSGEPFDTNSSAFLSGSGDGPTSQTFISFAAATAGTAEDEVTNVRFRLNDIDGGIGIHRDVVQIIALDGDGNPVPVVLTPSGGDVVTGNTVTANNSSDTAASAGGSVLVEIAGPVASVQINYSNGGVGGHGANVTDVFFNTQPIGGNADSIIAGNGDDQVFGGDGNDTIAAGAGADNIFGQDGDDLITISGGDTADGGDGDDTFVIDDSLLTGGAISIVGGESGETNGDTLDLSGLSVTSTINITNPDDAAGGLSGTASLSDGTVITFSEIENIICFTEGTAIMTPSGERRVEALCPGDMVLTLDHGPQPVRWIGKKTVRASGSLAPIRFLKGTIGNHRDLLVSPQHRMIVGGYLSQLHFAEPEVLVPAKSLVDDFSITVDYGGMVTYVHMLFDRHEIVLANGAASESFFPGNQGLNTLTDPSRDEIFRLFPELRSNLGAYGPASRVCIKPKEATLLLSA